MPKWTPEQLQDYENRRAKATEWSDEEIKILRDYYENTPAENFRPLELIAKLKRPLNGIYLKASKLGIAKPREAHQLCKATVEILTKLNRERILTPVQRAEANKKIAEWYASNPHPKGFLGKHHSEESKQAIRISHEGKSVPRERVIRGLKTKAKNGTLINPRLKTTWHQGWHEIGGNRCFFRSSWEVKYAHYLEWRKKIGDIQEWEYEPETFWFPVKKGCTNYTPDFRVSFTDRKEYHEVKGWMDKKSKTKINRMRIHHLLVMLRVIGAEWFRNNNHAITCSTKQKSL